MFLGNNFYLPVTSAFGRIELESNQFFPEERNLVVLSWPDYHRLSRKLGTFLELVDLNVFPHDQITIY